MLGLELSQILTQLVAFLIVLWVMKKFAWKPFYNILENRRQKIQSEFDSIAKQKEEIENTKKSYEQKLADIDTLARDKVKEGIKEGQKVGEDIKAEARQEAKGILDRTQGDIAKEISKAQIKLKTDIINLTMAATQKIIHQSIDVEKQKKLIEETIAEQWHESH